MEYTAPVLRVVGTAQALVLGGDMTGHDNGSSGTHTSPGAGVLGLDD